MRCAGGFIVQLLPGATEDEINHLEKNIKAMPSVTTMLEEGKTVRDMLELALEGFQRRSEARSVQCGMVVAARELPGRFGASVTLGRGLRSGCQVPHPGQHALHALFPGVRAPVPVPEGTV